MMRLIALLTLLVSAVVHFGTYFGVVWPHWVMWLHVVVLGVVAIGALAAQWAAKSHGAKFDVVPRAAPRWLRKLVLVLGVYAGINFMMFLVLSEGGGPSSRPNGTHYLSDHGRFVRELTPQEYRLPRGAGVPRFLRPLDVLLCCRADALLGSEHVLLGHA